MRVPLLFMACATFLSCSTSQRALELPDWPGWVEVQTSAEVPWLETEEGERAAETLSAFRLAIEEGSYADALKTLSFETRLFLDHHHPEGAERALEEGRLQAGDHWWSFDPLDVFAGPHPPESLQLATLEPEEGPALGTRRVVLQDDQGENRWTVIRERDQWRIHRPRLAMEQLQSIPPPP